MFGFLARFCSALVAYSIMVIGGGLAALVFEPSALASLDNPDVKQLVEWVAGLAPEPWQAALGLALAAFILGVFVHFLVAHATAKVPFFAVLRGLIFGAFGFALCVAIIALGYATITEPLMEPDINSGNRRVRGLIAMYYTGVSWLGKELWGGVLCAIGAFCGLGSILMIANGDTSDDDDEEDEE